MRRGSGPIRPHLSVLLLLTEVLAGLLLRAPAPSVPTPLSQDEVGERIAAALPTGLSPLRRAFVKSGAALVGQAGYFWSGKSDVAGWDARWGVPTVVTTPGSGSNGENLPFGLDYSDSVSWCAVDTAEGPATFTTVGGGVRVRRTLYALVDWADALPGDLAFYPDLSHVGIVASRGADGGFLVLHCSCSLGGVVCFSDAEAADFTSLGRPPLFEKTP